MLLFKFNLWQLCNCRVTANPENPPKIDWAFYKSKVPVAGLVDQFQKAYTDLKVPYPAVPSSVNADLDSYDREIKKGIVDFKVESDKRIEQ